MSTTIIRDGYYWKPVPCPFEYRILLSKNGDFDYALDVLENRTPSPIRLATVLTQSIRAKFAHDVKTDQWYKRGRKIK